MAYYSNYRMRKLELDGRIQVLFSPEDHDLPANMPIETIRKYPSNHYDLQGTEHKYTPKGTFKPSVEVLRKIIYEVGASPSECVYVGDSLFKDIAMAQDAGIDCAWAKYGVAQQRPEYALLRDVTHWTNEDVEREKISQREVAPDVILEAGFYELPQRFSFQ